MSLLSDFITAWRTDQARAELTEIAAIFQTWADDHKSAGWSGTPYFQRCADLVLERLAKL